MTTVQERYPMPDSSNLPEQPEPPTQRSAFWTVRLLGGFTALRGAEQFRLPNQRAIRLLFLRLILTPGKPHHRDDLASWLWPKVPDPGLRRERLKRKLSDLRKLLEPPPLPVDSVLNASRTYVKVNSVAVWCDTAEFESAIERGDFREALLLWSGELLLGETDEWLVRHRQKLAVLHGSAMASKPLPKEPQELRRPSVFPYSTKFFGREAELAQLKETICANRLVVVEGGAGFGKTRLAVKAIDGLPDPFFRRMVPLVDVQNTDQFYDRIGRVLGVRRDLSDDAIQAVSRRSPEEDGPTTQRQQDLAQIQSHLRGIRAVLLLDSVEELMPAALARDLSELLASLPCLHLVLTSRRVLHHAEAAHVKVRPMEPPRVSHETLAEDRAALMKNSCLALYEDRAKLARSTFQIRPRNLLDVAALCSTLEGVPIAIELAAARVRDFSPGELSEALRTNIDILARPGTRGKRHGRHSSLDVLLRLSWDQLETVEKSALTSLSVFRDGANLQAWEAVNQDGSLDAQSRVLVEWSLVETYPGWSGEAVFRLMPLVRRFVAVAASAVQLELLRRRHEVYFAERSRLRASAPEKVSLLDDWEVRECELAMRHAIDNRRISGAVDIASGLDTHWLGAGVSPRALDLMDELLQQAAKLPSAPPTLFIKIPRLLLSAGRTEDARFWANYAFDRIGTDAGQRAAALFARIQLEWLAGGGYVATDIAPAEEALNLARSAGLPELEAKILLFMGAVSLQLCDLDRAEMSFDAAGEAFRNAQDPRGPLLIMPGQTACMMARKEFHEAISLAKAGAERARESGDVSTQMQLCDRLAVSYEALGEFQLAIDVCREQVVVAHAHGLVYHLAFALWNQCSPLVMTGRSEVAIRLLAFSRRFWEEHFGPLADSDSAQVAQMRNSLQAELGPDAEKTLWQSGWDLGYAAAIALASP